MDRSLVQTSKFLSLVLRHQPERIGLTLDGAGWAEVDELLAAARRAGVALDRPTLERVVAENDKQRFALSPDGTRIRASQGREVRRPRPASACSPSSVLSSTQHSRSRTERWHEPDVALAGR